jgi:hypothetical protein
MRVFARLAVERMVDELDSMPIQSLPVAVGILTDKAELLSGGVTSRVGKEKPNAGSIGDMIASLTGADASVLEAEEIGLAAQDISQSEPGPAAIEAVALAGVDPESCVTVEVTSTVSQSNCPSPATSPATDEQEGTDLDQPTTASIPAPSAPTAKPGEGGVAVLRGGVSDRDWSGTTKILTTKLPTS